MKKKTLLILLGLFVIAAIIIVVVMKVRDTSIEEGKMQRNVEIEMNAAQQKAEADRQETISDLKSQLSDAKADLDVQKGRMDKIKEFQLGRLPSTRDQEIYDQSKVIQQAEQRVTDLENKLSQY